MTAHAPSEAPFALVPLSFAAYLAAVGFLPCSDLGSGGLAAGNASPAASNQDAVTFGGNGFSGLSHREPGRRS